MPFSLPNLQHDIPLAPYTTFKIGGPAKYFVVVTTADDLGAAVAGAQTAGIPWYILGNGSDLLIADAGFPGLIIKSELREVQIDDATGIVTAGSGVLIATLIRQTLQHQLSGIEFAIGVPASVGGAVWANLGARGAEIKNILQSVDVLDEAGQRCTLTVEQCGFGYRDSIFKHQRLTILAATFQLIHQDKQIIAAEMNDLAGLRKDTQDVGAACAGCVFRNPAEQTDIAAAKLIDELGLKGFSMGGAQVSDKHANFIINTGTATADDVAMLISYIKQQVRDKRGIQLMEEIEYVGF